VILAVRETLCVGATTARNLVGTSIRVTTVVTTHQTQQKVLGLSYRSLSHLQLVRDVQDETMVAESAARLITPVMRGRVTVTALVMVIEDAKVTWYVVETTVRNMVRGTMRRMIVARSLLTKDGVSGRTGHRVTLTVGSRVGLGIVMVPGVLGHSGIKTDLASFEETVVYSIPLPL